MVNILLLPLHPKVKNHVCQTKRKNLLEIQSAGRRLPLEKCDLKIMLVLNSVGIIRKFGTILWKQLETANVLIFNITFITVPKHSIGFDNFDVNFNTVLERNLFVSKIFDKRLFRKKSKKKCWRFGCGN